jgi:hypothetical protein
MGSGATEGCDGLPLYISETRNLYRYKLNLLPVEDGSRFDLIQERGGSRKLYEGCAVTGFELRINRGEAIHLKLGVQGERAPGDLSLYRSADYGGRGTV